MAAAAAAAAAAALRKIAPKFRIPGAAALRARASQASAPSAMSPTPLPKGELEKALLLKNNIETAKDVDLSSSADLLAKHIQQAEESISHFSERHGQVAQRIYKNSLKFFCTAVVFGSVDHLISEYWFDGYDAELLGGQVEVADE
ncbi:uncharacterized protein LOC119323315 [Triticum dicoccoides]|uniref:uncharacterized protein LOC119323315 n=1 Tax=Triticum dicoccoides TaxID=85692 RepID=UPI001891C4CA|nr:uncharacterized protein LOC119323315 [Triticum dicoccoides]